MKGIRVSAKAVIIRDGQLLVTVNKGSGGEFRMLPGGGQDHGEEPRMTDSADEYQTGIEWCSLADLPFRQFYPKSLIPHLRALAAGERPPLYIGAVN